MQNELQGCGEGASSADKIAFCSSFLDLCDFIDNADGIRPDEPALKYAHQWFSNSGLSNSVATIGGFIVDDLRKRMEYFDNQRKREPSN